MREKGKREGGEGEFEMEIWWKPVGVEGGCGLFLNSKNSKKKQSE